MSPDTTVSCLTSYHRPGGRWMLRLDTSASTGAGCTTHHEVEAHTDAVLLSRAREVVVVADSSKIGRVAFAQICPLAQIDEFITDRKADPAQVAALEAAGVSVTIV